MQIAVNALAATRGGAVTMLKPFLSALRRLEHDWQFTVYVRDARLEVDLSSLGVTTVVLRTGRGRRSWLELIGLDRRARKDGAILMLNLLNSGSLVPRLPSITWQRNALYFDRRWLVRQPIRMRLEAALRRSVALLACRASVATVAPSRAMAGYVQDWPLGRGMRIVVIPHGVDAERFTPVKDRPREGGFTIGVIGHAASHRGHVAAVQVLGAVRRRGVDATLLLTVPRYGNPAFQSAVDDAAATADLLGLSEHVTFGGETSDPAAWYRRIDLLLIPSECESFCFPLVEGFASGLPVVTSGLPALREIAGDLALHGETPLKMATCILDLYKEPEVQRLQRSDLERMRAEDFAWGDMAVKLRALVIEILHGVRR